MNIEEIEEPKKYENYHAKPVSDPFKSIAGDRKARELPRKINLEEVEEPETTKIHMQNPVYAARGRPKVWENAHSSTKPRKLRRIVSATSDVNPDLLPLP